MGSSSVQVQKARSCKDHPRSHGRTHGAVIFTVILMHDSSRYGGSLTCDLALTHVRSSQRPLTLVKTPATTCGKQWHGKRIKPGVMSTKILQQSLSSWPWGIAKRHQANCPLLAWAAAPEAQKKLHWREITHCTVHPHKTVPCTSPPPPPHASTTRCSSMGARPSIRGTSTDTALAHLMAAAPRAARQQATLPLPGDAAPTRQ